MTTQGARFVGSIPENYDKGLGPRIFVDYAQDLAMRAAKLNPGSVLELAAGTGIVSRRLRDALTTDCELLVSDLNPGGHYLFNVWGSWESNPFARVTHEALLMLASHEAAA